MRLYSSILALWLLAPPAAYVQAQPPEIFERIQASMKDLSRVTGLKEKHKVRADLITKDRLKSYLEEQIKRELKPEGIRAEELALKKLGLVPADFDLARTTVELMTEQAAAFYDYRKKTLFLLEGTTTDTPEEQQTVLTHELAHALADQHFNLNKYLHRSKNDDSSIARMAVMEGQATWLMYELQAEKIGQSLTTTPAIVEMMSRSADRKSDQYPVLNSTPLYMRASLLFPYMQGLRFQNAVQQKLGREGFSEVFKRPPANSQEILHPEKYLAEAQVETIAPPILVSDTKYKDLNGGTLGEFDHAVLIEQYVSKDEADSLSPHWTAGTFRVMESKSEQPNRTILLYASRWDDLNNARRMFAAYRKVLAGKWKKTRVLQDSANLMAGEGDDGFFCTRLDGLRVTSIEGLKTLDEALKSSEATAERLR